MKNAGETLVARHSNHMTYSLQKAKRPNPVLSVATIILSFVLWGCSKTEPPKQDIDFMSFNIRYGTADDGENHWNKRKPLVFDVFTDHAPDVVGLQEALDFQIEEILEKHPQFASVGIGREPEGQGEHCAILYLRDTFEILEQDTFWLSDTPETPSSSWGNQLFRICTYARIENRANGSRFYIFNTHFDHRSESAREESARFLVERIANRKHPEDPYILMGDFNAGEDQTPILTLLGKNNGSPHSNEAPLVDTFRVLHPDALDVGTGTKWIGKVDGNKIDYVLAAPTTEVLKAEIIHDNDNGRYPSDHYPVKAKVRF